MTERYLPIDGDILVRVDGAYFETYMRIAGKFERQVSALLSRPTAIQAWLDGWRVTLVKSTQDVMGHELCGFYREEPAFKPHPDECLCDECAAFRFAVCGYDD